MYKIIETTDNQYIGKEVEFTFDPVYVDDSFTFEWTDVKKPTKTTLVVSNSNYSMILEKIIS